MNKYLLVCLVVLVGCAQTPVEPTCNDRSCFIEAANNCDSLEVELVEPVGTFKYTSANCIFTKTVISLNEGESQAMKDLLKGKSFSCSYEQGSFDERWVTTLLSGLEDCNGDLKEIIGKLLLLS